MKIEANVCAVAVAVMLAASAVPAMAAGKVCDVKKYGAKGDGASKDTVAIQKAIDECSAGKGGGTVVLEAGTYVSAPILLKSNMTLELKKGATLLGSPDHEDYPEIQEFRALGHQALVSAVNAENVAIKGEGVIDGNGASWWHMFGPGSGFGGPGAPRAGAPGGLEHRGLEHRGLERQEPEGRGQRHRKQVRWRGERSGRGWSCSTTASMCR
jgi:hypothetical protein